MKQYSNLDVYGKIKQKVAQGTADDDVVLYGTLTDRVPAELPSPTGNSGKAIMSDGTGYVFGDPGLVDDVRINGQTIVTSQVADIPIADDVLGAVRINGGGLTIDSTSGLVSHSNTLTAGNKGTASKVPKVYYDANGHITSSITEVDIQIAESQVTNLTSDLALKAPLASPALTGTPTAPTASQGTNSTQIATTAFVKTEINSVLAASDAMQFKGTLGTGGTITFLPNPHSQGDTYKVITAGTYAGKPCEEGDLIICIADGTAASNNDWTVVQTNIDGAVTGPASATDGNIALFDGTTGKLIKNSSYSPSSFAAAGHTHPLSLATSNGTSSITLAASTKYQLTAGGSTYIFTTPPNTTYTPAASVTEQVVSNGVVGTSANYARQDHIHKFTLATGDNNGQIKVAGTNVSVKGLGSAAYTESSAYATSGHTHTLSLEGSSGTSTVSLTHGGKFQLTAGGNSVIFTMPAQYVSPISATNVSITES